MNTIHLDKNDVPPVLRRGYMGRKFQAEACETVTISNHAGYWDGGSRDQWYAIRTVDGSRLSLNDVSRHPGAVRAGETTYTMEPGVIVVCHSMFCGKDMGLRFHGHPADITPMLPATTELTDAEAFVLHATRSLKSSYGGRDRFQMATDYPGQLGKRFNDFTITRADWEAAKAELIGRKLLNKAGAITVAGRNAIS